MGYWISAELPLLPMAETADPATGGAFVYTGTFSDLAQYQPIQLSGLIMPQLLMLLKLAVVMVGIVIMELHNLLHRSPDEFWLFVLLQANMPKIEIQNYYKGGVTPDATASDNDKLMKQRYYTFRYTFQSDGSKKF